MLNKTEFLSISIAVTFFFNYLFYTTNFILLRRKNDTTQFVILPIIYIIQIHVTIFFYKNLIFKFIIVIIIIITKLSLNYKHCFFFPYNTEANRYYFFQRFHFLFYFGWNLPIIFSMIKEKSKYNVKKKKYFFTVN